jgi:hypothetical protein
LVIDIDSVLGLLHRADVGEIANASAAHVASNFWFED